MKKRLLYLAFTVCMIIVMQPTVANAQDQVFGISAEISNKGSNYFYKITSETSPNTSENTKATALPGETVTVTLRTTYTTMAPQAVRFIDENNNEIKIAGHSIRRNYDEPSKFTFVMPSQEVSLEATFGTTNDVYKKPYYEPAGNATPASEDGSIAAVPYVSSQALSREFSVSSESTDTINGYIYKFSDGKDYGTVDFSGEYLKYTPNADAAGKNVTLYVKACSKGGISGQLEYAIKVNTVPSPAKSRDISLSSLSYKLDNGSPIEINLEEKKYEYSVVLPFGTAINKPIAVQATTTDANATIVDMQQVSSSYVEKAASFTVKAEDDSMTKEYKVHFRVEPDNIKYSIKNKSDLNKEYKDGDTILLNTSNAVEILVDHGSGENGMGTARVESGDLSVVPDVTFSFSKTYPITRDIAKLKAKKTGSTKLVVDFYKAFNAKVSETSPDVTTTLNLVCLSFSLTGGDANKIIGSTSAMEYRFGNDAQWTECTADMDLTEEIAAMNHPADLQVRIKGTDGTVPGDIQTISLPHYHCICGISTTATNHINHSDSGDITFTEFTGTGGNLSTGSYYLANNVNLTDNITIAKGETVNLCLNGKVLNQTVKKSVIENQGTFNLCDVSAGTAAHKFSVDLTSGLWKLNEKAGTELISGGVITGGNNSTDNGGAIYNGNILTLYSGNIAGNTTNGKGGGVYNNGTFTMSGGSITGNISRKLGGGVCNTGTVNLSGDVNISKNKKFNKFNNIYTGAKSIKITGALTGTGNVGVNMDEAGVITSGETLNGKNPSDYISKFTSDNSIYSVVANKDNQLELKTLPTAAEYAANAKAGIDYIVDENAKTLNIKTPKGAAYFSANGDTFLTYTIYLTDDIDLGEFIWTPVGGTTPFSGTFHGQDHFAGKNYIVSNLTIIAANKGNAGFFGYAENATIENLSIGSGSIIVNGKDSVNAGGIVGKQVKGTILNCYNNAVILVDSDSDSSMSVAGGVAGSADDTNIINCENASDITVTNAQSSYAGGIVGAVSKATTITNCYNIGLITASGAMENNCAGGIVGKAFDSAKVTYCYNGKTPAASGGKHMDNGEIMNIASDSSATSSHCGTIGADKSTLTISGDGALLDNTLLAALNKWVDNEKSTKNNTWLSDELTSVNEGYPVFGPRWVESHEFTDITDHWAQENIEFVVSRGLMNGISTTNFAPDEEMTRGMFVTVIGRLAKVDVSNYKKSSFSDVNSDFYYMAYIEWAAANKIVKGIGGGKFDPDAFVTREQMASIIHRYASAVGFKLPEVHKAVIFSDNHSISAWAAPSVKRIQMAGILIGKEDNIFDPQGIATRAEVCTVFQRFLDL